MFNSLTGGAGAFRIILAALISYLLGNISPSIIMSRAMGGDIRSKGSGNAGTTNMLRTYGKKAAALTLLIDAGKGALAVAIGRWLLPEAALGICVVAVICGHIWPCLYEFKGGKGVATTLGALLCLSPKTGLIVLAAALIVIVATKMVSAGSVLGAVLLPLISRFTAPLFTPYALAVMLIVVAKHRANISRILSGTESKISFKK